MIIIEKNKGKKIPYEVKGTTITFDDELSIKLAKLEKDDPVHKDICYDQDGDLCIGAAAGWAYVAEIDIPEREYRDIPDPEAEEEGATRREALPMDMDKVTLTLWAID